MSLMTFEQANKVADARNNAWHEYYNKCGRPTLKAFEDCVLNAPEGVFSYNAVSRTKGVFLVSENNKGVFEYPCSIIACSSIPDDAYLTEEELNQEVWDVISRKEIFDW